MNTKNQIKFGNKRIIKIIKMAFGRFFIGTFFCVSLATAQPYYPGDGDSDFYGGYYYTVVTTTYEVFPQDDLDADVIVKGGLSETAFASILPYREKIRRMTIIREVDVKQGGVTKYMDDDYIPQDKDFGSTPFKDLVFGLTKDENLVLGAYLQVFFDRKDETWIIIAMVLCKDIQQMIDMYDTYHSYTFKELRKKQRGPFEHMLRVWVREPRQPNEKGDLDKNQITQDVNNLRCENDNGGWKENRDQLESVLIKKSIKDANEIISEFEKAVGKPIEDVIQGNVQSHKLNHDLADAYSAIAKYIKNRPKYIAEIMTKYCDGSDHWSAWIMCLAVVSPYEWSNIDDEFKKANNEESLTAFILDKMTNDKVMAEMIAAVIDPNFKPTTFTKVPLTDDVCSGSTPPPATPTTTKPTPAPSN